MLPLAHLGIGSALGRSCSSRLPFRWLLLGTLLPDLLDKPGYLILEIVAHHRYGEWALVTQGIAHTAFFLSLLGAIAFWQKSALWSAVAVGTATHLLLDVISKALGGYPALARNLTVVFWPALGWKFPASLSEHHGPWLPLFELIGCGLLLLQLLMPRLRPSTIQRPTLQYADSAKSAAVPPLRNAAKRRRQEESWTP